MDDLIFATMPKTKQIAHEKLGKPPPPQKEKNKKTRRFNMYWCNWLPNNMHIMRFIFVCKIGCETFFENEKKKLVLQPWRDWKLVESVQQCWKSSQNWPSKFHPCFEWCSTSQTPLESSHTKDIWGFHILLW